jgi:hypothetical protein
MSDGPHRSLNMHRSWKRLAECADNPAYSLDEVAGAFLPALDQSCREEVPDGVWRSLERIFADQQQTLFAEQKVEQIAALRPQVVGLALGCALVDSAVQTASKGALSPDALVTSTTQALALRATRGNKQVEEHFYRKSNERRTEQIRERLESGLKNAALDTLARQHLNMSTGPKSSRSSKQAGLDDGVQL